MEKSLIISLNILIVKFYYIYDFNDENPTYWSLASLLVEGWMNSSGHRRNILNPEYKYLGCGAWPYNNPEWPTYKWFKSTQDFSNKDAGQ